MLTHAYDSAGRKVHTTYPEGSVVSYLYDDAGRLAKITNGGGRTYSYGYDNVGRRSKITFPNGVSATYSYDAAGGLTLLQHKASNGGVIASFAYTLDKAGNRFTKTEPGGAYSYQYDKAYQLLQAMPKSVRGRDDREAHEDGERYTYDAVGRLLGPELRTTYSYGPMNQLLSSSDTVYSYDGNGNLVATTTRSRSDADPDQGRTCDEGRERGKGWSYTYDFENRLIRAEKGEGHRNLVLSFKYDPFGRRIEKRVQKIEHGKARQVEVHSYSYDDQAVILEYDLSGKVINKYVHGSGVDEPLALTTKKETYFYHADGLGSVVAVTDQRGQAVQTYRYDSFGNLIRGNGPMDQPFAYTAREWDKETGLYYYRARYYDPFDGRFINIDPLGINGGKNLYAYTRNNPINFSDPTGLKPGDKFPSIELAVTDAIMYVTPMSKAAIFRWWAMYSSMPSRFTSWRWLRATIREASGTAVRYRRLSARLFCPASNPEGVSP